MTNASKVTKRKSGQIADKDKAETKANSDQDDEKAKPKYGPMPRFSGQRVWSRGIIILGVIVYVWYTSKDGKETTLALQKDVLQQRGQSFECDKDFTEEIIQYPGCVPKKCGRFVSDKIVTANEAEALLKLAKRGLALGGSDGGASILDLHSGALSQGKKFINIYSLEDSKKVFQPSELAVYKIVKTKIQHAIAENFQLDSSKLHLTHPTFFSQLTNLEPQTDHDEYWHAHVDKVTYESFHYTSLLYLSDFGLDFKGGRLVFLDGSVEKATNNVTMEPRKGRVAMFSSGAENVHYVERVTSGTRYAITVSFTCDITKSIKDPVLK